MVRVEKLDVIFTMVALAFGVWVLARAATYGITGDRGPGAGTFPMIAGLLITVFSATELVKAVRRRSSAPLVEKSAENSVSAAELLRIVGILAIVGMYVALFPVLGAFLTLPFLMVGISLVVHWRVDPRWLLSLTALCVGFTFACHYVFAVFLRVLLPEGPFGF